MWVLSAFSKSENCNLCVFCFGFFPLDKQLKQAILHLPTLELSIKMAQTMKWKKQTATRKKFQTTTNFGIDVHPLSSSNKQ